MPLPKSLTQPLRQGNLTVGSGWRAYFAPFNEAYAVNSASTSQGPTMYDLLVTGKFVDGAAGPPAGWFDLGWVDNFKFTPGSKIGTIKTGYRGVTRALYRAEVDEKLSFKFREMGRMQLQVAHGAQVFNLVKATGSPSTVGPLSSTATAAVAMSSYSASGSVSGYVGQPALTLSASGTFVAGDFIVCDQDYNGTDFGYVGDNGANLFQGATTNVDFIRMTSDYVATVKAVVGGTSLVLTAPFCGGGSSSTSLTPNTAPSAGAKVQKIWGFASREGGTSIRHWSGVFTCDTMDLQQLMFYWPHIAPDAFAGWEATNLPNATSLQSNDMSASFNALGFDDPLDGETVTSYRAYFPRTSQTLQI